MIWPFNRWQRRSWRLSELDSWSDMGIGSGPTAAGVTVSPETAMTCPAVFSAVSVLARDVAKTPIRFRRRVAPDTFADATDHRLWEILYSLPNAETTAFDFKAAMMRDVLAYGRAYAEIVRLDGRVEALWRLEPTRVHVDRDENRRKRWRATLKNGQPKTWTFDPSQPPIFELTFDSPIARCKELIGVALALQKFTGSYFGNGSRLGGLLIADQTLDTEEAKSLRELVESIHKGPNKAHRLAVLWGGLKYQSTTAVNRDSQTTELLNAITSQIAGAFGVPLHRLGDLTKATYSNMEGAEAAYISDTLDPFFEMWQHAIRRDLLTVRQYHQFDAVFDRSSLIRNNIEQLHNALARGRDAGFYSVNDVRRALGLNPISTEQGGDVYTTNGTPITPGRMP